MPPGCASRSCTPSSAGSSTLGSPSRDGDRPARAPARGAGLPATGDAHPGPGWSEGPARSAWRDQPGALDGGAGPTGAAPAAGRRRWCGASASPGRRPPASSGRSRAWSAPPPGGWRAPGGALGPDTHNRGAAGATRSRSEETPARGAPTPFGRGDNSAVAPWLWARRPRPWRTGRHPSALAPARWRRCPRPRARRVAERRAPWRSRLHEGVRAGGEQRSPVELEQVGQGGLGIRDRDAVARRRSGRSPRPARAAGWPSTAPAAPA